MPTLDGTCCHELGNQRLKAVEDEAQPEQVRSRDQRRFDLRQRVRQGAQAKIGRLTPSASNGLRFPTGQDAFTAGRHGQGHITHAGTEPLQVIRFADGKS